MKFIYCLSSNRRLLYVFNRFICLICTEIGPSVYPPIVYLCFLLINRNTTITIPVFNVELTCSLMSHGRVVFVFPLSFIECCCNKSGLNQSEDQRVQHDEVSRTPHRPLWFSRSTQPPCFICLRISLIFYKYGFFFSFYSAPSSRSEPSPKTSRQSLSIKQAFLGGKADGRLHSPHSPKAGEERRALKGKNAHLF